MYQLRRAEELALLALEKNKQLKVVILEGAPGTGKTAFSQYLAEKWQAQYLYYLCHHWTSDEELFISINVGKVVSGIQHEEEAYQLGVLAQCAHLSQDKQVVLCLDELDKAPIRAESLLLDFLQHGRVILPNAKKIQGTLENITVVITTNGVRPLQEAILRRGFRLKMEFLAPNVESDIIRKETGAKMPAIRLVVRMMGIIRSKGSTTPSLQEGKNLIQDMEVASSASDVELLIKGWLVKEPEDWTVLCNEIPSPHKVLWGEWQR